MQQRNFTPLKENIELPFENDEEIIGKWKVIAKSEDNPPFGGKIREIFFLPKGEQYWCFSWTKGKFLFNNGEMTSVNSYTTERRNDDFYMTIAFKSCDYPQSGEIEAVTLLQLDNKHYTKEEITKHDNMNLPFKNDERVIGKWYAFDFIKHIEDFSPSEPTDRRKPFFSEIEFLPGGSCTSVYGENTISGDNMQTWTKGFVLRKFNGTACAYELRCENNKEFLIMEWKSGDYRWGGMTANYYVFTREKRI